MKKLIILSLLALVVSVNKAKAWCVLCYHPIHGAAEQLMEEDSHHIAVDDTLKTQSYGVYETVMYDKNRMMKETVKLKDLTLTQGELYHFYAKKDYNAVSGWRYYYYIAEKEFSAYDYKSATDKSQEVQY